MSRTTPPAAPAFEHLPPRGTWSTGARSGFSVSLRTVTPVLGGGYRARAPDDVDLIRVPTVRGHLRFWWRALVAGGFEDPVALYQAETRLWGGAGGGPDQAHATRSLVVVDIEVTDRGSLDEGDIDPAQTPGAYVLFPARSERPRGQETRKPIPRRSGVAFTLTITAPADDLAIVRDAVRAWILFGGYGGRTRRGLGGLTVTGPDAATWLPVPNRPLAAELGRLFGRAVLAAGGPARQTPMLAGATLCAIGRVEGLGVTAWLTAVDALRQFRQGSPPNGAPVGGAAAAAPSAWARQPGSGQEPQRPSISNWPEPDKIRHLADRELGTGPYEHTPRHNDTPVWPRAGFGLPIVGRFQTRPRRGRGPRDYREPPAFTLTWRERGGPLRDRLASPLIIKALPLVGDKFVAVALWLHRAWPAGEVVMKFRRDAVAGSAAPFDALVAPGDTPRFAALAGKSTLRSAFFDWLAQRRDVATVFPHRDGAGGAR